MSLLVLGLDHRTAPVELRERLSVERDQLPDALEQLAEYVPQSVIVSTCNRTEVYTYDPDDIGLVGRVGDFLIGYSGVPGPELERHIYQLWESGLRIAPVPRGQRPGIDDRWRATDPGPGAGRFQCRQPGRVHQEPPDPRVPRRPARPDGGCIGRPASGNIPDR